MKSIQNQYIALKEGKLSQYNFMRNVRMTLPHLITNVTSFNDTVRILKNKQILTEVKTEFPCNIQGQTFNSAEDVVAEWEQANENGDEEKSLLFGGYFGKDLMEFKREYFPEDFYNSSDDLKNDTNNVDENKAKKAKINKDIKKSQDKFDSSVKKQNYLDSIYHAKTLSHLKSQNRLREEDTDSLPDDNEGPDAPIIYTKEKYASLLDSLKKLYQKKPSEQIAQLISKLEAKIAKTNLNEGKKKLTKDQVNPIELRMGIKVEMEHTKDPKKAEKIALDHLCENPFYYTELKLSGIDAAHGNDDKRARLKSNKKRTDLPVETKAGKQDKDSANAMKTPKGVEKIKSSAAKAKKETIKPVKGVKELTHNAKKAKGIKQVMDKTGGKSKVIKESVSFNNPPDEEPNAVAQRLKEFISSNPILNSITEDITISNSGSDKAILVYDYYRELSEEALSKLQIQFNVEKDNDPDQEYGEDNQMFTRNRIHYVISEKTSGGFRNGVDLGASFGKIKEIVDRIVKEELEKCVPCQKKYKTEINEVKTNEINIGDEFTMQGDLGIFQKGEKVKVVEKIDKKNGMYDIIVEGITYPDKKDTFYNLSDDEEIEMNEDLDD